MSYFRLFYSVYFKEVRILVGIHGNFYPLLRRG